ncbi:hypothetical protein ACFWA6_05545 [Streptomyces sp. NPDC060020]|uniref:hypothetical protein n=1 Tax=Streptomyces sp. NPDC060020 TaxID=3347038 RepID=UPI003699E24E
MFLNTGEECNTCQYRAAERIAQAKAAQLLAEQQVRAAAAAELRARQQLAGERKQAHGEALEENARREEAAARRAAREAAAAAEAEETARLRAELTEQFAALDAGAARPVVPAPLHAAHDQDPADPEADAFPAEEDPFAPGHFENEPVLEAPVPDDTADVQEQQAAAPAPWSLSHPNALYEAAKAALAS